MVRMEEFKYPFTDSSDKRSGVNIEIGIDS